jgi:hypothetical protein
MDSLQAAGADAPRKDAPKDASVDEDLNRPHKFPDFMGPWVPVPLWLLDAGASPRAIKLYVALGKYAKPDGTGAFPSRATLARDMGLSSPRSVDDAIDDLQAVDGVEVFARKRSNNGRTSNGYVLRRTPRQKSARGAGQESAQGPLQSEAHPPRTNLRSKNKNHRNQNQFEQDHHFLDGSGGHPPSAGGAGDISVEFLDFLAENRLELSEQDERDLYAAWMDDPSRVNACIDETHRQTNRTDPDVLLPLIRNGARPPRLGEAPGEEWLLDWYDEPEDEPLGVTRDAA